MKSTNRKWSSIHWFVAAHILAAAVIVAVVITVAFMQRSNEEVDSFETCKAAAGAIAESYPEQCFFDGKSFPNDKQSHDSTHEYVGLAEQKALDKASQDDKAARVVERDGESLPATTDFMKGRLNLFVKDSIVYKVEVEGEEN